MSFRMLPERTFPPDIHRSGWPRVLDALHAQATDDPEAPLLDDFVDAHFSYRHVKRHYTEPWVGIFHHPAVIKSPLAVDLRQQVRNNLQRDARFRQSLKTLRGAICLTPQLGAYVREWLRVPVLVIKHPTETNVCLFNEDYAIEPRLWQIGFFLRDLRMLHKLPLVASMPRARSQPNSPWVRMRDVHLRKKYGLKLEVAEPEEVARLSNAEYDERMSKSVVCTHLFGAAANNVVVEAMARNCPLLVNKLADVMWYVGKDYPLYYDNLREASVKVLDTGRLRAASQHMAALDKSFMDFKSFADQVKDFIAEVVK